MKFTKSFILILAIVLLQACGSDDNCPTCQCSTCVDFETQEMLVNYTDNLIIPAYTDLSNSLKDLKTQYDSLADNTDEANLTLFREKFDIAYLEFQAVSPFDFGPAFGSYSLEAENIYPTDTTRINEILASDEEYDLNSGLNYDAIGFPAIDYLVNHDSSSAVVITKLDDRAIQYLGDLITGIQSKVSYILNAWQNEYRSTFTSSLGVDGSSSLSLMVNKYNEAYEEAKNAKVGIPSGRKSSFGTQYPAWVESYYGGNSLPLLRKKITALKLTFLGDTETSTNNLGLDDNLIAYDREDLVNSITAKFDSAFILMDAIDTSIDTEINSGSDKVGELYDLLQSNVANLKSDMSSTLNVVITYQDGDGD